jgi:hypothetical protein
MNVDLTGKSAPELLKLYNEKAKELGLEAVKRFADTKTALRRTTAILTGQVVVKETKPKAAPTPAAPKAPDAEKKPAAEAAKGKKTAERKTRGMRFVFPVGKEIKTVKEGSKRHMAMTLLLRPEGATFEQVQKKTGWERKDCYEGIRLLHYYVGYGMFQDADGTIHLKTK